MTPSEKSAKIRDMLNFITQIFLIGLTIGAGVASGQDYPNKPIRVFASEVGANTDFTARLIGSEISSGLRQRWVIENRPSNLLGELFSKVPPDGYSLLIAGGTFTIGPLLQKMSYDPVKDFSPITTVLRAPNVVPNEDRNLGYELYAAVRSFSRRLASEKRVVPSRQKRGKKDVKIGLVNFDPFWSITTHS